MENLGTESVQKFLFGQCLGDGTLGVVLVASTRHWNLGTHLLAVGCNLLLGSIFVDHSDRSVAVGVIFGDLLRFLQLAHLVKQGRPPRSEGEVHEQVVHILACAPPAGRWSRA